MCLDPSTKNTPPIKENITSLKKTLQENRKGKIVSKLLSKGYVRSCTFALANLVLELLLFGSITSFISFRRPRH